MSTLFITEFSRLGRDAGGYLIAAAEEPPVAQQVVAITAGSVQSAMLSPNTRFVRLQSDATCSIELGANPTATTTSRRIAANSPPELVAIPAGAAYRLAAIVNT